MREKSGRETDYKMERADQTKRNKGYSRAVGDMDVGRKKDTERR